MFYYKVIIILVNILSGESDNVEEDEDKKGKSIYLLIL